jgi:iron complex transport system substrate-binding protein
LSKEAGGKGRIIENAQDVIDRQPDIIVGSWCGKKFRPEHVAQREGWGAIPAVQNNQIFEIKSVNILQPGPAALTDGLAELQKIVSDWVAQYD